MPRPRYGKHILLSMNITITGSHIDLTDALKNHVDQEFNKLEKLLDSNTRVAVEIGKTTEHHKQGNIFRAEARIIEPKAEYFADIVSDNLYTAVSLLSDELSQQVIRSKDKHRTLLKRGRSMIKKLLRL